MSTEPSQFFDAYVRSGMPVTNFGDSDLLHVRHIGSDRRFAFVRFDVPANPGFQVGSAQLWIYCDEVDEPEPNPALNTFLHMVGSPWEHDTLVWNERPSVQGGAISQVNVGAAGWYAFDITPAYQAWLDGDFNYGVRLAPSGEPSRILVFRSSNYSDPNFHPYVEVTYVNKPPNQPTISQGNFDATEARTFGWTFNHDDPNSPQTDYRVEILDDQDATAYDSGKTAGDETEIQLLANTLDNGEEYKWRVKTWTTNNAEGPWSEWDTFKCQARPVVSITTPTAFQVVESVSFVVQWDYSNVESQASFRVRLFDGADDLVHDSGIVNDDSNSYEITDLLDNETYRVEVEAFNQSNVANEPVSVTFSVDTEPPSTPQVTVTGKPEDGIIEIDVTNPAAGMGEQAPYSNSIFRRPDGETEWALVASGLGLDVLYNDATVTSGVTYEYRVRAFSEEGTFADVLDSGSVSFYGVWLAPHDNPSDLSHFLFDGVARSESWAPEMSLSRYHGRTLPVVEFGTQTEDEAVRASVQLPSGTDDRRNLDELARRRVPVRYRDVHRRNFVGVISGLSIDDAAHGGNAQVLIEAIDADF